MSTAAPLAPVTQDRPARPGLLGHSLTLPPGRPRALLCAVHGMGMTRAYFSTHADLTATLTVAAAGAGLAVLAPDRPGYGASAHLASAPLAEQAQAVEYLLETCRAELGGAVPVVLVGHSLGGGVALEVAARGRVVLAGLEVVASGYRLRDGVDPERSGSRAEAWGPPSCYPPGTFALAREAVAEVPPGEVVADARWSARFLTAAARVRCPVRVAWPVNDRWWRRDADEAEAVMTAFPLAPWVTITTLLRAGHNMHLGVHASHHHELTFEFISRCLEEFA